MFQRVAFILLGFTVSPDLPLLCAKSYIWTDINGQKIEADFVGANESTVTISMEGQELDLPLGFAQCFLEGIGHQASFAIQAVQTIQIKSKPLYDWQETFKAESFGRNLLAATQFGSQSTLERATG